jgi:glycogen synthase
MEARLSPCGTQRCPALAISVAALLTRTLDIPENRELVEGSGFTFRPSDRNDLERMLRLLISEPEVRKAAAGKARAKIREHYLWGRVAKEIERMYLEVAGGNLPKPASVWRDGSHRAA